MNTHAGYVNLNHLHAAFLAAGLPATLTVSPFDIATIQVGEEINLDHSNGRTTDGDHQIDLSEDNLIITVGVHDLAEETTLDTTDIPTIVAFVKERYDRQVNHKTEADLPCVTAVIVFYFHTEVPSIVDTALAAIRTALTTSAHFHPAETVNLGRDTLVTMAANYLGITWLETNLPHFFAGYGVGIDELDAAW